MASDDAGDPSYDSDFMDEDAFNRYLGGQSDSNDDSASEVGDMSTDANINHTTVSPLEELPLSFVDNTYLTENSSRSANRKPFVLPEGAMVIDLDTWNDEPITSLFGEPQLSLAKEEPQEVATTSIPRHYSDLPQEQSAQEDRTHDSGGDGPMTMTPDGNLHPSAGEDEDTIGSQTDAKQYEATKVDGNGLPSPYVPHAYIQPTVEEIEEIKEEEEVESVWENLSKDIYTISDDDDETLKEPIPTQKTLPTAVPKRTFLLTKKVRPACSPAEQAKFRELQKQLAEKAVSNNIRGGAGTISGGRGSDVPTEHANNEDPADPHAWMHEAVEVDDEDAARKFALEKKKYNSKKRKNQTTFEEDAAFMRAENLERARLKRLEIQSEMTIIDGDEEELFVSSDLPIQTPLKWPYAATVESGNDDDDLMDDGGIPSIANKRSKHNPSSKTLDENILNESYLAGIEAEMAKENMKGKKAKKGKSKGKKTDPQNRVLKSKAARGGQHSSDETVAKTKNPAKPKSKGVKGKVSPENPDLLHSLLASDLYAEANAALSSASLPLMTATKKEDALKQFIASVPLGDQRVASEEKKQLLAATISLGKRRVRPDGNGGWNFKGMISSLQNHQVLGAAWMRERETGIEEPLGGILADEMGFGKTIQLLACMISNPPSPDNPSRATLIVVTPALLSQWCDEISKHIQPQVLGLVMRYHAGSRLMGDDTVKLMQQAGIVLTTYNEVLRSYPRYNPPKELESHEERVDWWKNYFDEARGVLHRVSWYRVVLDEAHAIKNHLSLTSMACRGLVAKRRWAISGTPIQNSVEELYPYFKFLHVSHTGAYGIFKKNFCDPKSRDSNARVQIFLRRFLIRRTHADRLFGAPLINLPKNNQDTLSLEFNGVERGIYDTIRLRYVKAIMYFKREGRLEKCRSIILTMLLRLRQLTAHPFLLQDTIMKFFKMKDVKGMENATTPKADQESGVSGKKMLEQIEKMIAASTTPGNINDDAELEQSRPLVFRFRKYLRDQIANSKWQALSERSLCSKCRVKPHDPVVTNCLHLYCSECIKSMAMEAAAEGQDSGACLTCGVVYSDVRPCNGLIELGLGDDLAGSEGGSPMPRPQRNAEDDGKWITMEGSILPSTKTVAMVAQIEQWLAQAPDCKIIIFTQWQLMIEIIGGICAQQGWGYGTYHGKISHEAREKTIHEFRKNKSMKILVANLKCGGVGLNLTCASRVICIDLWWNHYVEAQAFCRVFRIGQDQETFITRFVVKNTVDENLQKMQESKGKAIEAAIGDDGSRLAKLSTEELVRLFGPLEGEDGKEFIFVDDDDEYAAPFPDIPSDHEDNVPTMF